MTTESCVATTLQERMTSGIASFDECSNKQLRTEKRGGHCTPIVATVHVS